MKNFSTEFTTKAETAKSADELFEIAKTNNIELTEEEAKTYFEQLNADGTVADNELEAVAGGAVSNKVQCPYCTRPITRAHSICPWCGKVLIFY